MRFDLSGRLDNMRLPDGKTAILYSIFEAVSNSLHAIDDRFGEGAREKGIIDVLVQPDQDTGEVRLIEIRDNGIGLDAKNLEAFDTCDSRNKRSRGGKGIGRLIWLKLFEKIRVRSTYLKAKGHAETVEFRFTPDQQQSMPDLKRSPTTPERIGTEIVFEELRAPFNLRLTRATLLRDLALHFFAYFIADAMPRLTVTYGDTDPVELGEYIRDRVEEPVTESLPINGLEAGANLEVVHIFVDKRISKELRNSILLVAHNRLVERIEIEQKFALNRLPDKMAYIAVVRGAFLDDRVDQERTGFKLTEEQHAQIHEAVLRQAESFLGDHIARLRKTQKTVVTALLEEHPQLAMQVRNVESYVSTLGPGMSEEDIGKTLFTLLYRDERKLSREVQQLSATEDLSEEARTRVQTTIAEVTEQAKGRLAEYVVKRRQIIDLVKTLVRYREGEGQTYHYERAIHDLICPMGKFFKGGQMDAHNLWIVDDLLAYYSFFASDKQIKAVVDGSDSQDEPDIVFVNPMGFRRVGTNDPVVLVEFKRPGDETPTADPVDQVLRYIEKLRGKTVRDQTTGDVLSEIRDTTPFQCFIICDLTEGTRRLLDRSLASYETPDGQGYFGFAPKHRATLHVVSYQKMLKDAELRNQIFFEKLGLVISN